MSERRPCIRCNRNIDAFARICPYCNWDQNNASLPEEVAAPPAVVYEPPSLEAKLKKKALWAAGGVLLLIVAFGIGYIINRDGAPKVAPETLEDQAAAQNPQVPPIKRADTPLVPMNEPGGIEQPITSAPNAIAATGATPDAYQRTDATAVSSVEYAQMAKRAKAERERMAAFVDPRSITGAAYAQGVPERPTAPRHPAQQVANAQFPPARVPVQRTNVMHTRPIPESQYVPPIASHGSAKLTLMIGTDGRVHDVNIERALEGGRTAALIRAVQSWRFRPATENGHPVAAPYTVEINFGR